MRPKLTRVEHIAVYHLLSRIVGWVTSIRLAWKKHVRDKHSSGQFHKTFCSVIYVPSCVSLVKMYGNMLIVAYITLKKFCEIGPSLLLTCHICDESKKFYQIGTWPGRSGWHPGWGLPCPSWWRPHPLHVFSASQRGSGKIGLLT